VSPEYGIVAASGGFGNHIRLMLLLDSKFFLRQRSTIKSKLTYIKNSIYHPNRTWHNWLLIEHQNRTYFDHSIYLDHGNENSWEFVRTIPNYKVLLCTVDPGLSYRCYVKFNSNLNNVDSCVYKREMSAYFNETFYKEKIASVNPDADYHIISSDRLFTETLDYDLYTEIIQFFNLENQYEHAAYVHKLWFALQLKAEKEMIEDLSKIFNYQK